MKHFLTILFGGLGIFTVCMGLAYGGSARLAALVPQPSDGTVISGLTRSVRYTADEEEDLISAAALSLPSSDDKDVDADAYVVKDLTKGTLVIGHNADTLLPIASLTKLVTAVVARKLISADARITITPTIMETYGNTAEFRSGETFTAADLLYPMLMVSSNDAAEAYAYYYGRPEFIQAMNDFTQSIGAYRTYFADPSGLSPENVSTADDLVLILNWIRLNDPAIIAVTELKSKTVRTHTWVNPTHFLSWSYYLGGKNGFLPEAKDTGASLFMLGPDKDVYAVIVLDSHDRDADVIKLLAKVKD